MFHVLCKAIVHFHECVNKTLFDTHLSSNVTNYCVAGYTSPFTKMDTRCRWVMAKQNPEMLWISQCSISSPTDGACCLTTDFIFLVILQHEGVKSFFLTSVNLLITRFLPQDNLWHWFCSQYLSSVTKKHLKNKNKTFLSHRKLKKEDVHTSQASGTLHTFQVKMICLTAESPCCPIFILILHQCFQFELVAPCSL